MIPLHLRRFVFSVAGAFALIAVFAAAAHAQTFTVDLGPTSANFEMQNGANAKTIEALSNTNLQISEGLLDKRSR